jgi:glycosyltransferase involved in cell wall biosynthesis
VNPTNPIFSIITPVFNGKEFIEETIRSVLKYAPSGDFEYLIVNDGSTDSTSSILNQFADSVTLIEQMNQGEAASVNNALKRARGKYALVVSADDPLISAQLFSLSRVILDRNQEVIVTYPEWCLIDKVGKIKKEVNTPEYSTYELVGLNKCIPGPGAIFRIHNALSIGGRSENLKFGSDYEFWLRMSNLGKFQRIPKVLAQWRSHENSTSIKSRGEEMAKERIQIIEGFLSGSNFTPKFKRTALANAYYSAAILRYFSKSVPHRRYLRKAFTIRRGFIENARITELVYLALIPVTEILWSWLKKYFQTNPK